MYPESNTLPKQHTSLFRLNLTYKKCVLKILEKLTAKAHKAKKGRKE
jgi:hypothetical protein